MKKKLLSLLLAVIMVVGLFPVASFADGEQPTEWTEAPTFTVDAVKSENIITVTVKVNSGVNMSLLNFKLNYPSDKVTLNDDAESLSSTFGSKKFSEIGLLEGKISYAASRSDNAAFVADYVFLTATFTVKEKVAGEAKFYLTEFAAGQTGNILKRYTDEEVYGSVDIPCLHNGTGTLVPEEGATCIEDGHKAYYKCDICENAFFKTYTDGKLSDQIDDLKTWLGDDTANGGKIDKLEHEWSEGYVNDDSEGHYYECTRNGCTAYIADKGNEETINTKAGHTYNGKHYVQQGQGKHAPQCDVCGYIDTTSAEDHTEGNTYGHNDTRHWKLCSVCGEQCTEAAGHTYEEGFMTPCEDGIHHAPVCDECGYVKESTIAEHALDWVIGDGNNDVATGKHAQGCSDCGYVEKSSIADHTLVWVIGNDTNGVETGKHAKKCSVCGYVDEETVHAHEFTVTTNIDHVKTEATCQANKICWKTCECGEVSTTEYFEVENSKLPHGTGNPQAAVPAKCNAPGRNGYYICSNEGCDRMFYVDQRGVQYEFDSLDNYANSAAGKINPTGRHEGQLVNGQSATCIAPGWNNYYQCKNGCDDYYEDAECTKPIDNLETWKNGAGKIQVEHGTNDNAKKFSNPATCTEDGVKDYFQCDGCDGYFYYDTDNGNAIVKIDDLAAWKIGDGKLAATNHQRATKTPQQNPTCTVNGVKAYWYCADCKTYFADNSGQRGEVIEDFDTWKTTEEQGGLLKAPGHSYGTTKYEWDGASCTATKTCNVCADGTDEKTITETKQGTYVKDVDKTCTTSETGHYEITFTDTQFGSSRTDANSVTNGNPLGHDYGTPTYTWSDNDTKCTASVTCRREGCNHVESEVSNAVYTIDSAATCTEHEKGHYKATFTNAAFSEQNTADNSVTDQGEAALGHDYGTPTYTWSENDTICTASVTCKRDGCGHDEQQVSNAIYEKESDPTCTEPEKGHYTAAFTGIFRTQTKVHNGKNPHLGHNEVHNDGKAATCTESGTKEYWYCDQCKNYYSDEACTTLIGGEDALTSWKAIGGAGYIAPLGHVLPEYFAQAATCTEKGYKDYWYCSQCETYFSNEGLTEIITDVEEWKSGAGYIAPLGHNYTLTSSKAATCNVDGEKVYTCDRCNGTKKEGITAHHTYDANGVCTGCGVTLAPENVTKVEKAVGEVESGTGENTATVNTPAMDILNAVAGNDMPANIVEQIADGATLNVTFTVKESSNEIKVEAKSTAESYKEEAKKESEKGKDNGKVEISAPIEIDLKMLLGDTATEETPIHNLSKPIEIAVPVPEDIQDEVKAASGKVVEYFMLRIHQDNGTKEVKVLKAWIDNGKYCFETDKLSTFVPMIVVSDPEPEERPHSHGDTIVIGKRDNKEETKEVEENPNTGAPVPSFGIALVVLGAASLAVSKKRK